MDGGKTERHCEQGKYQFQRRPRGGGAGSLSGGTERQREGERGGGVDRKVGAVTYTAPDMIADCLCEAQSRRCRLRRDDG